MNINTFSRIGQLDSNRLAQLRQVNFPAQSIAAPVAAPAPTAAAPAAVPAGAIQNLMTFGGDRKTAIGTLIASGAKAENPNVGFFGDVMRKLLGGTKTKSKQISASQTIATKVRVKNFNIEELRLSTKAGNTTRHIDFNKQNPAGGTAQVKDVGTVIAKGQVKRMFDQTVTRTANGQTNIANNYYDPKTGQNFLRTNELTNRTDTTKLGTVESDKAKNSLRQLEVLGADGQADRRYTFSYGKSVRLENLGDKGEVTSSYNLSKKTDFFGLVDRLSLNPPSGQAAAAAPIAWGGSGGGGRGGMDRVNMVLH